MGASPFVVCITANNERSAFIQACGQALKEFGDLGYTGSIAEKPTYKLLAEPTSEEYKRLNYIFPTNQALHIYALTWINEYWKNPEDQEFFLYDTKGNNVSEEIYDKWGPAGCFEAPTTETKNLYIFFGWASS